MLSPTEILIAMYPEKGIEHPCQPLQKAVGSAEPDRMLPLWAGKFGVPYPFLEVTQPKAQRAEGFTCPLKMYFLKYLYNLTMLILGN